jgi:hypothetical protein
MPVYTAPNGFEPVQRRDGLPYAGATREYPIASGYGTQLRRGDLVRVINSGAFVKAADTTALTASVGGILGVFLGCSYTDAVLGKTFRTYWTASTVAADAKMIVCDDPHVIYRAVSCSSGVTVYGVTAGVIGKNAPILQNTTKTLTSDIAIDGDAIAATDTIPMRVVDVDRDSVNSAGTFTAVFVTWAPGMHAWDVVTATS